MNFRESEAYLLSLGNEVSAMKLGLESIGKVLTVLGDPHLRYRKVQVAGTNGKGSVCAFLDAICRSAKIRTGLYTSPHLVSITERIKIAGKQISEEDFARHATDVRRVCEDLAGTGKLSTVPTFFEQITAIALTSFAEAKVELAILETGLGGRLDATTAAHAEIAAITRIDYDHQKILGETIEEIAAEKAAIIRADSKVAIAEQCPDSLKVIIDVCDRLGIKPMLASDVRAIETTHRPNVSEPGAVATGFLSPLTVDFKTASAVYQNVHLGLLGRHQIANAKVAILLAEVLQQYFVIVTEDIIRGLETAVHPGRLEFLNGWLFDGAHNAGGARALRAFLDEFVQQPITMIFGAMLDKDLSEIAAKLFPRAANLILTRPENERAANPADIAALMPADSGATLHFTNSVPEALHLSQKLTPETGLILTTGSLYLVGEVKKLLGMQGLASPT